MNRKIFLGQIENLYKMLEFIKKQAETIGFTPLFLSKIELASEEALVNIIDHGYKQAVNKPIKIECIHFKQGLRIIIQDKGMPYNPLFYRKEIEDLPLEKRPIGGYGIFFILNLMDEVNYDRINNHNILTLVKYL